jgi:hypothetical protein
VATIGIPDWAPEYMRCTGRNKYETGVERGEQWNAIRLGRLSAADVEARAYQEDYLQQLRRLLADVEGHRMSKMQKVDRQDWPAILKGWVMGRITSSRKSPTSSTVCGWIFQVMPRLPQPIPRSQMSAFLRGLATTRLLRPSGRLRQMGVEMAAALKEQTSRARKKGIERIVWMALTCMLRGAVRLADSVRMVSSGGANEYYAIDNEVIIFPTVEKTDMIGAREIEPVVLRLPDDGQRQWMMDGLSDPQVPSSSITCKRLEGLVKNVIHAHGIADVRAVRRTLGEAADSRKDAGILLRHVDNSKTTLRYSTTRDRVPTLGRIAKKVSFGAD